MIDVQTHLKTFIRTFQHPPGKHIALGLAGCVLVALIGAGIAWGEYQTNWLARRLGAFLYRTNALRQQTGAVWQQLQAQTRTRQSIGQNDLSRDQMKTGLPDPVRGSRFQIERIPREGPPGYVALWKTPLPGIDVNERPLDDITSSLRIYNQGLALLKALDLPDVHFHPQIRAQVDRLYAQLGDLNAILPDAFDGMDGTLPTTLAPDSIKAAVFAELAAEMIPGLETKEKAALLHGYKTGQITQFFLHRDLGRYRGELHRNDDPPITFYINTDVVSRILNIAISNPSDTPGN